MPPQELRARWKVAAEFATAFADVHRRKEFRKTFLEPIRITEPAGMQNEMCVLVRGGVEFAGTQARHHDVVLCFAADIVGIRGSKPVGRVLAGRAKCDDPDGGQMIERQSGLLLEKYAQLLKPQQSR